jgi:Uma2 family endonuclease
METIAMQTPPRTIMQVYKMLPEGTLAEVINQKLSMSPAPKTTHQWTIGNLYLALANHVNSKGLGKVFLAPCDVYLDETANVVQPDIFFISSRKKKIIMEDGIHGIPDFIIKVLSPGNSLNDKKTKKGLYEKFGVKEYWIVNPKTKEAIGYTNQQGTFKKIPSAVGKIKSVLFKKEFVF